VLRKTIAISFLLIFLCANTEIGQLLKLPNLAEHFFEHHDHEDEHNISFLDFVKSHYNDNHKHSDTDKHDEHQNLPFKTLNTNVNTVIAFENQPSIIFNKPISIAINNTVPYHKKFYTSNVFACIWLPPKLS
jgi:ABC-type Zn2+ transport system substrate-binding protein/surface adhesin